jgi:L-lactate dehydrogenase (cytochrome)
MVFDYVDGAARAEITLRENRAAFDAVMFRPRMAVPVADPDLSTTVLGTALSMPQPFLSTCPTHCSA